MDAGDVRRFKLKRCRGLKITAPCIIVLPEDLQLKFAEFDVIMLADGEILAITVNRDERRKHR